MDEAKERSLPIGPNEFQVQVLGRTHIVRFDGPGRVWVDGILNEIETRETSHGVFTMTVGENNYRWWAVGGTHESEKFDLVFNGISISGVINDRRSLLKRRTAGSVEGRGGRLLVKAPMPGMVTKILVASGSEVLKGQGVIVLEAMKMENELKADRAGVVQEILAKEGMPVEKGQVLMSILTP